MEKESMALYPFEVRYEIADGEGYYHVTYRDFDNVDGFGETIEEALATGREALAALIDYLESVGEPVPSPSLYSAEEEEVSGRVTFRMPKSLHRAVIRKAEEEGVSINTFLVSAVSKAVAEPTRKALPPASFELIQKQIRDYMQKFFKEERADMPIGFEPFDSKTVCRA